MEKCIYPFSDMRTGVTINNTAEEISECFRISHTSPKEIFKVQTKFGKWFWGKCGNCKNPIESWSHPKYCGHCGQRIIWEDIRSNVL